MIKVRIANILILSLFLLVAFVFFFSVGLGEITEMINTGSDDGWFGILPIIGIILLALYLFMEIKFGRSGREPNKPIKISRWINIITTIVVIILALILIVPCFTGFCDGLGVGLGLFTLGIILGVAILVSFILFLVGYFRKEDSN